MWISYLVPSQESLSTHHHTPQALYFCEPLRHHLAQVREEDANGLSGAGGDNGAGSSKSGGGGTGRTGRGGASDNSVLSQLAELFSSISKQKRRSGHLAPTEFLRTLRERNELFRGNMQQVTRYIHIYSSMRELEGVLSTSRHGVGRKCVRRRGVSLDQSSFGVEVLGATEVARHGLWLLLLRY